MSPERLLGQPYSYASDIWGLGLSLLALALGRAPLAAKGGYWAVLQQCMKEAGGAAAPAAGVGGPLLSLPEGRWESFYLFGLGWTEWGGAGGGEARSAAPELVNDC